MKLRNKKTGEIGKILKQLSEDSQLDVITDNKLYVVKTLAELNEEWEDYKEPKESEYYWYIGYKNDIRRTKYHHTSDFADNQVTETRKEIGNCFESLEEAEKAAEKLKAWKRLKDRRFRFTGYNACSVDYDIDEQYRKYISDDLKLLFGGEE